MPAFQCSKCGRALEEIGVPPQIQAVQMYNKVVNIGSEQVPEEIRNDPFVFRAFYCSACNKVFCPRCSNMQGEICPACKQRRLMPAYRPLLKKLKASSTSSTATERRPIKVVHSWKIALFLLFTLGIYHIFWLYRVFKELHTRKATDLSPGKAVGYGFIPFFNLVWIFVAWKKLGDAITSAYSQAELAPPATGVVWLPPISFFAAVGLNYAVPGAGSAVAIVLLSIALCTIQRKMNRLAAVKSGDHQSVDKLEAPTAASSENNAPTKSASVSFTLADMKGLYGLKSITILLDGQSLKTIQFGETVVFEVSPGQHTIQTKLVSPPSSSPSSSPLLANPRF